jgi:hypothetical protein
LITTPASTVGLWLAVDEANVSNGCMYVLCVCVCVGAMLEWCLRA